MRIQGSHGYSCKLKFKEQSIIERNPHQVLFTHFNPSYFLNLFCTFHTPILGLSFGTWSYMAKMRDFVE